METINIVLSLYKIGSCLLKQTIESQSVWKIVVGKDPIRLKIQS